MTDPFEPTGPPMTVEEFLDHLTDLSESHIIRGEN